MNTPSHVIINLFALGKEDSPQFYVPIIIGSILPDIAIFYFYFWAKVIAKLPDNKIWSEVYFTDFWQNIFAIPNSIVLCLIAAVVCHFYQLHWLKIMFISMIVHCLFDLPVHHDDAHRHFVPLTNYRFVSPVSYWDTRHYAQWIGLLEFCLVSLSSFYLFNMINAWWGKGLILLNSVVYCLFYLFFYLRYFKVV